MIRGVALLITGGYSIPVDPGSPFTVIGRAWFLGVPVPALIALAILAIGYLAFNETPFGRYVTGIGANAEAVRRAGVNTRLTTLFVYVISAAAAALAGIIIAARLGSGSSNAGQGFELEVIAAVVLGGTSLFGSRGTIVGTVLGALTVAVIGNGLILAHLSPFSADRGRDGHYCHLAGAHFPVAPCGAIEPMNNLFVTPPKRRLRYDVEPAKDDRARPRFG